MLYLDYQNMNKLLLQTMAYREESKRQWIFGLAITVTALVSLFGFWQLSPGLTFMIASIALCALVVFFWFAGKASSLASCVWVVRSYPARAWGAAVVVSSRA